MPVLRLIPDDHIPAEVADRFGYLRPVAEGLLAGIALDTPDAVLLLDDGGVAEAGDPAALWAAARANLVELPMEHDTVDRPDGTVLHIVGGGSIHAASKVLVLGELIRATTGQEPPAEGVLVTVPSRHNLAFHPVVDATVVSAVNELAMFGLGAYQDNPDTHISPRLYWWRDGVLTSLTVIDHETKEFGIAPPDELMAIMRRLTGR
ncbi:hypothetical protein [Streptomyces sp. I05A-00742]|uniref:hypothetical protein n=1 Tax=Streptomyces sp. I05A-00742 TaxID=2732853 RepID=UPI0014897D0B|nr:hypothetical protein [Streptomyces sp. I05A-00742]